MGGLPNLAETGGDSAGSPQDKTLKLTIPKMKRIENDAVPDVAGDDEAKLKGHAGIHLKGTDFSWREGANVYIAGHRLGYAATGNFLAFYNQNKLEKGDEIFVTDSEGNKYTYKVFESFIVDQGEIGLSSPYYWPHCGRPKSIHKERAMSKWKVRGAAVLTAGVMTLAVSAPAMAHTVTAGSGENKVMVGGGMAAAVSGDRMAMAGNGMAGVMSGGRMVMAGNGAMPKMMSGAMTPSMMNGHMMAADSSAR